MIGTEEAKDLLERMKRIYHRELALLQQLQKDKTEKEKDLSDYIQERDKLEMKKTLIQEASVEARNQAKEVLQSMGTNALRYIMGNHLSLEIELKEQARQQWVANFIVKTEERDDYEIATDPAEEEGGGVADVVALSTQTAMLQLLGEKNVAPLFLDEPSKFVSKGHSEQVANFLSEMSRYYNRQIFMVTHDEYLAQIGDMAYLFKKVDGNTVVTKVS